MINDSKITRRYALSVAGVLLATGCAQHGENDNSVRPSGSSDEKHVPDRSMRHTPRPIVDIAEAIPEFAKLARVTVRLHPRRGECADDDSKMGGNFIWPVNEPWPRCGEHDCNYVGILQIRSGDVPELGFLNDTDLFQLLWCPHDHKTIEPHDAPASQVFWRKRSEIRHVLTEIPSARSDLEYIPVPCVLHPERVTEYPDAFVISDDFPDLMEKIESSKPLNRAMETITEFKFNEASTLYQYWLSVADGTKVGGYPHWPQNPETPKCRCGRDMEYLLTVSSCEFDGGTWGRWLPEEERHLYNRDHEWGHAVGEAAGLMLGDMGNLNYFVCRQCDEWPIRSVFQCS